MTNKITSDSIAHVLGSILGAAEKDADNIFSSIASEPAVAKAVEVAKSKNTEDFFYRVVYPVEEAIAGLLRAAGIVSGDIQFIFMHASFVESHYQKMIEKHEGFACCADKSRTIMQALVHFMTTGKEIEFDYSSEYTYHLPAKLFKTHKEIIEFFYGVRDLYYGRPERYLKALAGILQLETAAA